MAGGGEDGGATAGGGGCEARDRCSRPRFNISNEAPTESGISSTNQTTSLAPQHKDTYAFPAFLSVIELKTHNIPMMPCMSVVIQTHTHEVKGKRCPVGVCEVQRFDGIRAGGLL